MKVLVTGATGFIGSNLARMLWQDGYQVRALIRPGSNAKVIEDAEIELVQGNILDRESVIRAADGCQALFHCAAAYTFWSPHPEMVYRTNVQGTTIVLDAARDAGVPKVVYTSTVSTIGFAPSGTANEDTPLDRKKLAGSYKISKYQAEQVALLKAAEGLPVVVVNPTAPVGPCDVKPTPTGRVVLDFLRRRIPAYLDTGLNLVDVEDVAAGHILAMKKGRPGHRYILGNRNVTLKQLFSMLGEIAGLQPPRWKAPFWLATMAGYMDQLVEGKVLRREPRIPVDGIKVARHPMYVDCSKAVAELHLPQSPVEPALARSIEWFIKSGYLPLQTA